MVIVKTEAPLFVLYLYCKNPFKSNSSFLKTPFLLLYDMTTIQESKYYLFCRIKNVPSTQKYKKLE